MPNLKEVKNRITSVISTQQITKAMKMVAAAKLRKAQDSITQMRPYADRLNKILKNVSAGVEGSEDGNPYSKEREIQKVLILVVTSDRGLCGAFNANISKGVIAHIEKNFSSAHSRGDVHILPLGKKGFDFFRKRNYTVIKDYVTVFSDVSFENVSKSANYIMKQFAAISIKKKEEIFGIQKMEKMDGRMGRELA